MSNFKSHLYQPFYDDYNSDQEYLDEGFVSSVKEKLGMAPKSKFGQALDRIKGKLGMHQKGKFAQALENIKSKLNNPKSGALGKAHEYLKKVNKGRLAANAAGAVGINLLANKLTGRSVRGDLKGGLRSAILRGSLTTSGSNLGGSLYDLFAKK